MLKRLSKAPIKHFICYYERNYRSYHKKQLKIKQIDLTFKSGLSTFLSEKEEKCLALWIEEMTYYGVMLLYEDIQKKSMQIYDARIAE
jgi:hypothetical protein